LNKPLSLENLAPARCFFERALLLEPGNIEALYGCAVVDQYNATNYSSDCDRIALLTSAEAALCEVLSRAPDHAAAHGQLGGVYCHTNRVVQGILECERALALDRNLAWAHSLIGFAKFLIGRWDETEPHVREALRL
jgi:tetratricopeptide (TPR) repeat protein